MFDSHIGSRIGIHRNYIVDTSMHASDVEPEAAVMM